jgi:hypothetical protein
MHSNTWYPNENHFSFLIVKPILLYKIIKFNKPILFIHFNDFMVTKVLYNKVHFIIYKIIKLINPFYCPILMILLEPILKLVMLKVCRNMHVQTSSTTNTTIQASIIRVYNHSQLIWTTLVSQNKCVLRSILWVNHDTR